MERSITAAGLLILLIYISIEEIWEEKCPRIDHLSILRISLVVFYLVPGILLSLDYDKFINETFEPNITREYVGSISSFFAILLSYVSFSAVYKLKGLSLTNIRVVTRKKNNLGYYPALYLTICLIFMYVWAKSYGSIYEVLGMVSLIRAAEVDPTQLSFLKRFFYLGLFSGYCYTSIYYFGSKDEKSRTLLGLFSSTVVACVASFLMASRSVIIIYFLVIYLVSVLYHERYILRLLLPLVLLTPVYLAYGDYVILVISNWVGLAEFDPSIQKTGFIYYIKNLIEEVQYPYLALEVSLAETLSKEQPLRIFKDVLFSIASVVPEGISPFDVNTISHVNTYYFYGYKSSIVPPGPIAFSVYSLSWPGIVITFSTLGFVSNMVEKISLRGINSGPMSALLYVVSVEVLLRFLWLGEPRPWLYFAAPSFIALTPLLFKNIYFVYEEKYI